MPIYEYECEDCKHVFEELQKFSDPPVEECPKCHKKAVRRLISPSAAHFKGSGWYVTDYKGKRKHKSNS